jgi:hypothetical protein
VGGSKEDDGSKDAGTPSPPYCCPYPCPYCILPPSLPVVTPPAPLMMLWGEPNRVERYSSMMLWGEPNRVERYSSSAAPDNARSSLRPRAAGCQIMVKTTFSQPRAACGGFYKHRSGRVVE